MPLTPTPLPFGFTSADIASIGQARQGLLSGFEELGKQIRSDIGRIATNRQLQGFGQELQQADPRSELFPQQAVSIMAKYPLAAQTGVGQAGINLLGRQHADWRSAREAVDYSLGPNNPIVGGRVYQYDESGNLGPLASEKPVTGRVIETPEGQQLINPQSGEVIQSFGAKPQRQSTAPSWTDLGGGKFLVNGKEVSYGPDGTAIVGSASTRNAPIDLGNGFMLNHQGIITGQDESGNPVVVQKIGTTLQNITNPLAPEVLGPANRGMDVQTRARIDAAKQGFINADREFNRNSVFYKPDSQEFQFLKQTRDDAKAAFDALTAQGSAPTQAAVVVAAPALPQGTPRPGPTPTPDQLPPLSPGPVVVPNGPGRGRKYRFDPESGRVIELP